MTVEQFPAYEIADTLADADLLISEGVGVPSWFKGLTDDSRRVRPGTLFVAVRGSTRDGHDFLEAAERAGATAAIVEDPSRTRLPAFVVRHGRVAAALAAAAIYDFPARQLRVIGVTGTNGKSTTVGILRHLLDETTGHDTLARSASIGTIGVFVGSEGAELMGMTGEVGLTTPGPIDLQAVLRTLVDRGVRTLAMEVSSHSLSQHRIEGIALDAAVFTNFTRDHLDYHGTMDAYFGAKARLLSYLKPEGAAVINADDLAWRDLPPAPRTITFSGERADVRAESIVSDPRGSRWDLVIGAERHAVHFPLIGDFNVTNALGAAAAAWSLGLAPSVIAQRLSTTPQVPGRLEILSETPTVLRDYAHTPDALARALQAVRPFTRGRLIVVFGAGGDRDRGKRPLMGEITEGAADIVILTSDNPRREDPEKILDDIEAGMRRPHERIVDREAAVERAVAMAASDDVVLLAGKGHETYQVRGETRYPFDERVIVKRALRQRAKG